MDKVMIALPGDKYYAVPREVLEKYAVPEKDFETQVTEKWKNEDTVFHSGVEGQGVASIEDGKAGSGRSFAQETYMVLGVRG